MIIQLKTVKVSFMSKKQLQEMKTELFTYFFENIEVSRYLNILFYR